MSGLSIVIPIYNNSSQAVRCVNSIYKYIELDENNYEVILADDFSDREDFINLEDNIKKLRKRNIIIKKNKENYGPAKTRNIGASLAKFDNILFLDSDTVLYKDISSKILKNLDDYDAVNGHYHYIPVNDETSAHFKALYNFYHFSKKGKCPYTTFNGACAAIKAKAFFGVKGYNEDIKFGMDYENEEIGRRIVKKHKMILDPEINVMHEFPRFLKMMKLYFLRGIPYVQFILKEKKLDGTGPGDKKTVLSIVFSLLLVVSLVFYFLFNKIIFLKLFFVLFICNFLLNIETYLFVMRKKLSFLPTFMLVNLFLNNVLFISVIFGLFKYTLDFFKSKL